MSDFEKTLCPGMSEDQYNILWVEHTDKGRIELNFVIPKIELTTQKAFNPYFHKVDFSRIDMFEDIQNIKYNLESKKDPANAQTLLGSKLHINLVKDYIALDKQLHDLTLSGNIQNREHLIELLKESGCKITRPHSKGFSVKLPDSKRAHRFKGSIYDEQFRSIEDFGRISKEAEQRHEDFGNRDKSRELEQTIKRLDEYNETKAQHNREKYQQKDDRYTKAKQEPIQLKSDDMDISINNDNRAVNGSSISRVHTEISRTDKVVNTTRDETPTREREIHNEQRATVQRRQDSSIHQDRGIDHDTRTATLRRIRARATAQRESYEEARQSRVELHKSITANAKELRAEFEQDSIELSREYATVTEQSRELINGVKEITQESESSVRFSNEINRTTTARERITNTARNFIEGVKEFGEELKQRFFTAIEQSKDTERTARQYVDDRKVQSCSRQGLLL